MKSNKLFRNLFMSLLLFNGLTVSAQDWANLNYFREANAALGAPVEGEKRVVFMGNSITEGWKNTHPNFFTQNPYVNRGIGGQTTPQMLIRFRQDVVDLKPHTVVILAGTNDIAGNTGPSTLKMIMDNLKSMAEIADANGIKVILCSVLPAKQYPWKPEVNAPIQIIGLNKMIKEYCEQTKFTYLDYYTAMVSPDNAMRPEYTTDGVHVTSLGYDLMEKMVQEAITTTTGICSQTFSGLSVYPNPCIDKVVINNAAYAQLFITDMAGKVVKCYKISSDSQEISVKNLVEGSYLFCLIKNEVKSVVKIVKG